MQSIFEKDNINFSESGGYINNVSTINFKDSSSKSAQLNFQTLSKINPAEISYLNEIYASDIQINNNLFVAGHTGMGSLSIYDTTTILGDLNIGTEEKGHNIYLKGNSSLYLSDSIKLDSQYLTQIKSSIETPEIKITDSAGNISYKLTKDYIEGMKHITSSEINGNLNVFGLVASDLVVNNLKVNGKVEYNNQVDGLEASSKLLLEAPDSIDSYHSGFIAIVKPSDTFWLIKFINKVGLFKIKKRTSLFMNKSEIKSIVFTSENSKSCISSDILDLIEAYNNKGYWEPFFSEDYDSSIFQCVLELNLE